MKIRILANSIRLRLTQTEVKNLSEKGMIAESIQFGITDSDSLHYILEKKDGSKMSASYSGNRITVFIPSNLADDWASTDQVSLESQMPLDESNSLHILVEKDFKCLTERGEDESDHFPNPAESC